MGVLFIGVMILVQLKQKAIADSYADADRTWVSGDKKGAIDKYRKLLDGGDDTYLTDEQKPLVYGRVIDYDAESGNTESASQTGREGTSAERRAIGEPPGRSSDSGRGWRKKSTTTTHPAALHHPVEVRASVSAAGRSAVPWTSNYHRLPPNMLASPISR